jgi:flavodoxin
MQKRIFGKTESGVSSKEQTSSISHVIPNTPNMTRRDVLHSLLGLTLGAGLASLPLTATAQANDNSRTLVAYLSRSGNTRTIAGYLQRRFQADLFEIRTATPYPEDYQAHVDLAEQQQQAGIRPELAESIAAIANYETVFLGFPIWGMALPVPVQTFLTTHDLSGKTIVPFITHGGYGTGRAPETVVELAPNARILEPFVLEMDQERATLESVSSWLQSVEPEL